MSKRILAILLSSLMMLSTMPTAFAEETETNSEPESSVAEEVVEEEASPVPTVELTLEPTIEPAEESTTEPTAVPTVEPTKVPNEESSKISEEEETITIEDNEEAVENNAYITASGTCGDGVTYTLDSEGTLTISGRGAIEDSAFSVTGSRGELSSSIRTVVIENGVTSIGAGAFFFCSVSKVTIPDSVTSIGGDAFSFTTIHEISLSSTLSKIGNRAFSFAEGITDNTYAVNTIYFRGNKTQWNTLKKKLLKSYLNIGYWNHDNSEFLYLTEEDFDKYVTVYLNGTLLHEYSVTKTKKATESSDGKLYQECLNCSKTKTSTIYKIASVKLDKTSYVYNGTWNTPSVTVKDSSGKTLKKNTDYTVSYASGRKYPGTYKVTVKFKGKYSGTKTLSFKIVPKGTTIKKIANYTNCFRVYWNPQTTQTSGYQIKYSLSKNMTNATYRTVTSNSTSSLKVSGLKRNITYYVSMRTYKTVNGTKVYSSWSNMKSVTTK